MNSKKKKWTLITQEEKKNWCSDLLRIPFVTRCRDVSCPSHWSASVRFIILFYLFIFFKVHYFKVKLCQLLSRCRQIHKGIDTHIHTHILNCGHFCEVAISNQIQTFWPWISILCSRSYSLMLGRMQLPIFLGGNAKNS